MNRLYSEMTREQLMAWCERHRLTASKSADALGIDRRTYYRYMTGRVAIPRTVALLCDALDQLAFAHECLTDSAIEAYLGAYVVR